MRKQKGQSLVEFAFIVPLFFAMCFGMIYGGLMFMDYLQYNNAARGVARAISLNTSLEVRNKLKTDFENKTSEYINPLTHLYIVKDGNSKVDIGTNDVKVEINLTLNEDGLPAVLDWINFPPKTLKPVKIVMPLESAQ